MRANNLPQQCHASVYDRLQGKRMLTRSYEHLVGAYGAAGFSGVKDARRAYVRADAMRRLASRARSQQARCDYWTVTGQTLDKNWTGTGHERAIDAWGEDRMNPLHALTPKAKARRFRALLPDIEAKIEAGVSHADILRALKAQGLDLLENTYFTYLRRYRRKRSKTEQREAQATAPSPPPANDAPGEQAARRPPTFEY